MAKQERSPQRVEAASVRDSFIYLIIVAAAILLPLLIPGVNLAEVLAFYLAVMILFYIAVCLIGLYRSFTAPETPKREH